ncbi:hypothetical protein HYC85_016977 [Camellia sinensis]|uniref:FACT complex subunit n=1 Tax=Camellia sinensis TaxID=4442 RepID=A0A7J7H187_CAMSI|nr:hypothetical protein HYC85_016977 [Camellia sinensis]
MASHTAFAVGNRMKLPIMLGSMDLLGLLEISIDVSKFILAGDIHLQNLGPQSIVGAIQLDADRCSENFMGWCLVLSQVLAIATPPPSEDLQYLKSSALNVWLVGYEFLDTIMKKASLLEVVKKTAKEVVDAEVVMHVKTKNDDGTALMDSIFRAVCAQSKLDAHDTPVVGYIAREITKRNLLEIDITNRFSDLFAVKDIDEITNVKKAAYLTSSVMKHFVVPMLEKVVDEVKKVSHSSLMDDTEKSEEFDLKPSASSNNENLYCDSTSVIICAIGSRYNSYCSNVARTFLIDANAWQSKAYEVLLKAHDAAISALKSGNKAGAAYEVALSVVEKDAPELIANLTKSAGTGIGLEFQESELSLNRKNDRVLKPGMNLQAETKNPKTQKFSFLLSGTVIVGENSPEVVTTMSSKAVKNVAYSFIEDEEEEEQPKLIDPSDCHQRQPSGQSTMRCQRRNNEGSNQAELTQQKNEETTRRLAGGVSGMMDNCGPVKSSSELIAYKNFNDLPTCLHPFLDLMIQIDQRNEAILLPIYGSMVPFHVAVVKSVSSQQDTNHSCYIRIIFNVLGTPFNPQDTNSLKFHSSIYIKEVSFCSKDPRHISEVVQLIKTLRRQVASRESEKLLRRNFNLQGAKFKPIRLSDLWIRPVFGGRGRKLTGTLEAYTNGFWYSTSRSDECAEIMFANIKHAFFQPAEREMITLLHFHLHNHIMVGNKKPKDVQFYVEVMDVVQTLGGGKRSAYDPDEIEEEQREDRKNKINMDFQNFVNWPFRDLGFHGVPHKASAFIVPTSSCLVELIETPESRSWAEEFDMTIVFKDFKQDVFWTDSIPSTCLDGIMEWLDTIDLKYYESRLNLNWRPILKTITDDPEKFIEDGGWEFLNMEVSDSDTDNSQESDKGYEPSDVQSDSVSEEEDDESKSLVESEDDDEEDSEEVSEEEEGKTWEELEREASKADREKGDESDSEDKRKRRKIKPPFGKAQVPDKDLPLCSVISRLQTLKSLVRYRILIHGAGASHIRQSFTVDTVSKSLLKPELSSDYFFLESDAMVSGECLELEKGCVYEVSVLGLLIKEKFTNNASKSNRKQRHHDYSLDTLQLITYNTLTAPSNSRRIGTNQLEFEENNKT